MRLNKGFGLFSFCGVCLLDVNNFKQFSFWPRMWQFPAMFCLPGTSSLAFLVGRIVISISRRMDCSLNENYINYGELRCDSVMTAHEFELPLVFLEIMWVFGLECVVPPLVITFEKAYICNSLATVLLFPLCDQARPTMVSVLHANLISCRVGFLLSCCYKSNSSYLFCDVICSALVICSANCDYVKCW